jgi:hypothetical protein
LLRSLTTTHPGTLNMVHKGSPTHSKIQNQNPEGGQAQSAHHSQNPMAMLLNLDARDRNLKGVGRSPTAISQTLRDWGKPQGHRKRKTKSLLRHCTLPVAGQNTTDMKSTHNLKGHNSTGPCAWARPLQCRVSAQPEADRPNPTGFVHRLRRMDQTLQGPAQQTWLMDQPHTTDTICVKT